jgi:hypothetical protein
VPGAITRQIALPKTDLTLERLDTLPLRTILETLKR